jgi:hypothetical protein
VAQITAQIQKPGEGDHQAALRTLALLDACAWAIQTRTEQEQEEQERLAVPEHLTFNEALKWMTGQKRPARAKKMFQEDLAQVAHLCPKDIENFFDRYADRDQVPMPKNDRQREMIRSALASGRYGGFTRQDLIINKMFIDFAQGLKLL